MVDASAQSPCGARSGWCGHLVHGLAAVAIANRRDAARVGRDPTGLFDTAHGGWPPVAAMGSTTTDDDEDDDEC
jgi:hypothetical protein